MARFVTVQLPSAKDGVGRALASAYDMRSLPVPDDMMEMLGKLN